MNTPLSGSTGCGTFVDFNGTSQYIYTDTNLSSLFTGTSPNKSEVTSIFMWIYPQGNGVILSEVGAANSLAGWHTSIIEMVSGTLKFGLWGGAGNSVVTSSISTPLNNWYYVGMTYDGSTLTAYVNGVSAGNITFNRQAPYNNGAGLYYLLAHEDLTNMGDGGFGDYRVGSLEIYTTSLNSTQITNNYTSSSVNYICPTPTPTPTPSITPSVTPTVTPSVTSTPTVTPTVSVTPSITSSVTPTPTQSAPFVTPTVTIVQPNSISTSFLYSEDNGIMYVNEQDQNTSVHSIIGYSGTSNTEFSIPNFYSGLTSYRQDSMINGPSNIIYVTGELKVSPGDVRIRRANTITNQVTHEYVGGLSDTTIKTLYYNHGGSDYIAFSHYVAAVSLYITILNASDLTLVGNYQYTPYLNNNNNSINSLLYSNGKLLWSMPVGYLPQGSSTAYGTFDLSTNTFTTGSTQSHNAYSERELLVGTDKVYGSTYVFNSSNDIISIGYGYYDYSNDTYTQIDVKTNPSGFNSYDSGVNNQSTIDENTGDIYILWLYDLVHIDGSTGNVVEVIDLVLDDIRTGRAIIFEMEFNEGQDNIWFEYLTSSSQGVIVIFE
jgi:hypothetical protein